MSIFALTRADMGRASSAVFGAGSSARSAHSADALSALATGLPGSTIAEISPGIGSGLEDGVTGWADDVEGFAEDLELTASDGSVSDELVGTYFEGMAYLVTGEA